MADTPSKLHVAHEADLTRLTELWDAARGGEPHAVVLTAPLGGGKRALVGELIRDAVGDSDDVLLCRVPMHDEEDGLQTILRWYAGMFQGLHRSPMLRGKVEMALNSQIPSQPKRVQGWYQAFIEGLKKGAPKPGEEQFQVIVPRDNPAIGLVEILMGIARKFPVIVDLQNLHHTQSIVIHAAIEALVDEAFEEDDGCHLLLILGMEPLDESTRAWYASPLVDVLDRKKDDFDFVEMHAWDADDVQKYLASRELEGPAEAIARMAGGRPGFVAEVTDWLNDAGRLGEDLADVQLATLADSTPDPEELNEPDEEPAEGKRKHVGSADAEMVAHLAALLGLSFPSGLLADMGGFDRESVDDLLDATEQLYKELQFSQPLGTWVYQFNKAILRESVLARHESDEDKRVAVRAANFLERFLVPRGYPYLVKTLRIYAEYGEFGRAAILRSMALGADQPQVWAMVHDMLRYFDETEWPAPMRRTVYMHLVERMVQTGDVNQTERLWGEAMQWATDNEDRPMQALLLFSGSRLDHRRQDLYRARDRAIDAAKMFKALGEKTKQAEITNHLAMIELADGNPNAAIDRAKEAEELAAVPPIQAHSEFIRGQVARRDRKQLKAATEHFRKANELAGRAGMGPLALEAGLALGETMLVGGQASSSADVLGRVVEIARGLRNPTRERAASALLAQAQASLKNFEAALTHAQRTLELTRELKFERLEAIDLYNVGFFSLMLRRPTEAISLMKQAREKMDASEPAFQKELLFNLGQALLEIGEKGQAIDALQASLDPSNAAKDWRKVLAANRQLGDLEIENDNNEGARKYYEAALKAAEAGNMKEDRKTLRRKIDQLGR